MPATLLAGVFCIASFANAEGTGTVLTGDTNKPILSTFIPGEPVVLLFHAEGLKPDEKGLTLQLDIIDEHDQKIGAGELSVSADQNGKWEGQFKAPREKLGFYRVLAKLSNGISIEKTFTRPAGFISYCVVSDPAKRKLYPHHETFFGMSGGFSDKVNILPYLGIRWVYGGLMWSLVEKDHPGELDDLIKKYKSGKADIPDGRVVDSWKWPYFEMDGKKKPWKTYALATLSGGCPDWAAIPETKAYATAAIKPDAEKHWSDYCRKAAAFYAEIHADDPQRIYQITWEPVYPWGYKGTDEQLVRIYELAYPAIHEGDPKAIVIGPTWSGCNMEGIRAQEKLFALGLGKYLDGVSNHPYKTDDPEKSGLLESIAAFKEMVRKQCGKDLPFYGTEQGWPTDEKVANELRQARGNIRSNLIELGEGWKMNFAFYIADYPGEPGYGFYYNLTHIPHGSTKISPKPVVPAYAAMTCLLEGHKSTAKIEWLGEDTLGYAYQAYDDADNIVIALWDYSGNDKTVSVPVGVPAVTVLDWMGNPRQVMTDNGNLTVKLSEEPVYITGASKDIWGANAVRPLTLKTTRATAYPSTTYVVKGTACLPRNMAASSANASIFIDMRDASGTSLLTLTELRLSKSGSDFEIPLPIATKSMPGKRTISTMLSVDEIQVFSTGMLLEILSPVSIEDIRPVFDADGRPAGISMKVSDKRGIGAEGTMSANLQDVPESDMNASFKLSAKGNQSLELKRDGLAVDPSVSYVVECSTLLADGFVERSSQSVNFASAPRLTTEPRNGIVEASEWSRIPLMRLSGRDRVVRSPDYYDGDKDEKVSFQFAWDKDCLYLRAEVEDDAFYQPHTGFMTWKGDCIQLGIDLDADKPVEVTGNVLADTGSRRYSEIDLAQTSQGPEAFRTVSFNSQTYPVNLIAKNVLKFTISREGNKTLYQAAIPWKTLGATSAPRAGAVIGFAATFNDRDDEKQLDPSALGCFELKNPTRFGKLVLLPSMENR